MRTTDHGVKGWLAYKIEVGFDTGWHKRFVVIRFNSGELTMYRHDPTFALLKYNATQQPDTSLRLHACACKAANADDLVECPPPRSGTRAHVHTAGRDKSRGFVLVSSVTTFTFSLLWEDDDLRHWIRAVSTASGRVRINSRQSVCDAATVPLLAAVRSTDVGPPTRLPSLPEAHTPAPSRALESSELTTGGSKGNVVPTVTVLYQAGAVSGAWRRCLLHLHADTGLVNVRQEPTQWCKSSTQTRLLAMAYCPSIHLRRGCQHSALRDLPALQIRASPAIAAPSTTLILPSHQLLDDW